MAKPDYGRARWYGADSNGYSSANRPDSSNINKIVVHITQGSWSSAINWFDDPRAGVSAHYVIRSKDGFIGQCVQEKDIAYHAGDWQVNKTSIGIEHEGYGDEPGWLTDELYNSSARLSAYLANKYDIPINRDNFLAHRQVSSTKCPGNYWDWDKYMRLVRKYAEPSYRQIVDNGNSRFSATQRWETSSYSDQKFRDNYRYTKPRKFPNFAKFKFDIPRKAKYEVFARWPADSGYNGGARFQIRTSGGWVIRTRSQRKNGGRWVKLGTFTMDAGDRVSVRLSAKSPASGMIIADAVMVKSP